MRCQAKNKTGKRCGAPAVHGAKICVMHSGRAAELGSRGGRRRAVYSPDHLKVFSPPTTPAELRELLAQTIVDIRAGRMDPKLANSISYLSTSFLRAVEEIDQGGGPANSLPATNAFQVYEAMWLREKKARWDAELKKKHCEGIPGGS